MRKIKFFLYIPAVCLVIFSCVVYAGEETLTITTYYPTPQGSFNDLDVKGNLTVGGTVGIGTTDPGTAKLAILSTVGIGTTNPQAKLHIESGAEEGLRIISSDAGNTHFAYGSGDNYISHRNTQKTYFRTYNGSTYTNRLVIDGDGDIGIKTDSPSYPLEVAVGDGEGIVVTSSLQTAGRRVSLGAVVGATADGEINIYDSTATRKIHLLSNGNSYFSGGNVGIGTGSPAGLLHVGSQSAPPLFVSSSTGNVGIGTTNPLSKLSVGTTGASNTGIYSFGSSYGIRGYSSGSATCGVYGNAYTGTAGEGTYIGVSGLGGDYGVYGNGDIYGIYGNGKSGIANSIGVYGTSLNATGIGVKGFAKIAVDGEGNGNGSYGVYGHASAYNGIGVRGYCAGNSGYGVYGQGGGWDFYAGSTVHENHYGSASSVRWKKNVKNIDNALEKILSIRGVYFNWDKEHAGKHGMGFIAEEVGEYIPEIVGYDDTRKPSNHYIGKDGKDRVYATGLDYGAITPMLVEAIKEQQKTINALKQRIEFLEKKAR